MGKVPALDDVLSDMLSRQSVSGGHAIGTAHTYINSMARDPLLKKSPAQKQAEAAEGLAAYRANEAAVNANMLRLRAERLAREAANPPEAPPEPAKAKPRKKVVRT